jgi:hypothetical protein
MECKNNMDTIICLSFQPKVNYFSFIQKFEKNISYLCQIFNKSKFSLSGFVP